MEIFRTARNSKKQAGSDSLYLRSFTRRGSKPLPRTNHIPKTIRIGRRGLIKGFLGFSFASIITLNPENLIINRLLNNQQSSIALADFTYDGGAASAWADQWAMQGCDNWGNCYENWELPDVSRDCTNFVSKAMYNGGFPMDDQWYCNPPSGWSLSLNPDGNWNVSTAWVQAPALRDYLVSTGYGTITNTVSGMQSGVMPQNGLVPGDILFYQFPNDTDVSHAAIQTTPITDNNGNYIDVVDTHSVDHQGVFWTLEFSQPTADDAANTQIVLMHINSNTAMDITY